MGFASTYFNGRPATVEDLAPLAFAGFAHFTAMQVRGRAVRGLDLHLERLRLASDELFGGHPADERVRESLSAALRDAPEDVSLTCYLTSRPGEFMRADGSVAIDVLVRVGDPATPPAGPLALDVVAHERYLPHIKHVGEVAKTRLLRRANARGFDDAVFTDGQGNLSEATIWNLAFWDGRSVIWPQAPMLPGVTMRIVRRQLDALGVDQVTRALRVTDISRDLQGVVLNSWTPGIAVSRIGEQRLGDAGEFVALLHEAYESEPAVPISHLPR
ncbi:aminotransferase class IV family protein [Nocardia farcinica]|uniref:aminotransferase class IV family protein n=1 Tax=Nocardia farcinica TaxID=37329 RepID=UPI002454CB65|nr:aminotransferase class IV family protein [Nocardia farcinica]